MSSYHMYFTIIEVSEIDVDISKKSSLSEAFESMYARMDINDTRKIIFYAVSPYHILSYRIQFYHLRCILYNYA